MCDLICWLVIRYSICMRNMGTAAHDEHSLQQQVAQGE